MPATKTKKTKSKSAGQEVIYSMVTDQIVKAIEDGVVPWRKPWKTNGAHRNFVSKHVYRGINPFLLDYVAMQNGYKAPYWLTFPQMDKLGGKLKKINGEDEPGTGQESTVIIFWKMLLIETDDTDDNGQKIVKRIPMLRYVRVFNIEQTEGIDYTLDTEGEEFSPIEAAEAVYENMPNAPEITYGGDRAFYAPMLDAIRLPEREQFNAPENFYLTQWHELAHSTGHEDRTGRVKDWAGFGSEPYGKEELVAEMTAAMVAGWTGIDMPEDNPSAAYVAGWLKAIKGDKKLVVQAASKASQAADYILGNTYEEGDK